MALFVVIAPRNGDPIQAALSERFPDDFYRMNDTSWVVSASGLTSRQISDKLMITEGTSGGPNSPAAVFQLGRGYWGAYPAGLWEWMQVKVEGADA
ncbi:MAG: hypothetical protein PGN25_18015 [Methylorubrum populi]